MDKFLNRIVNIALLAASIAIVVHVGLYAYRGRAQFRSPIYPNGSVIADTADLNFKSASQTLILITSSQCHFCQESMPFYKRLTTDAHKRGVRVVAVSAEDLGVHRDFLMRSGVYADGIASVSSNKLQVRGTPTLVVVDRQGVVMSSWEGAVGPTKEATVEAALIRGR